MELIEFTTPSGYKAFIRPYLTYGQHRIIQGVILTGVKVDPTTQKQEFDASVIYRAQDEAVKILVDKIVDKDGKEYMGFDAFNFIQTWSGNADGDALYKKVEEIGNISSIATEAESKKK